MFDYIKSKFYLSFGQYIKDERGVTAVEYAIIAVAMSAIILVVFNDGSLKTALTDAVGSIKTNMTSATTAN
ncbi:MULTISPECIES: Flp family type IVb pilin [Ferrimonas]|uniref:Flp family type IVb pilin n=1 Tax=Ferrimonas TaxID=44011 RepID=UPI00042216F3|nr:MULTISPECIES: Flp family type IVb pilin [Ferrimonas]BDY04290.1 hypothetical protein F0521_13310 [Ferrimonas sp. YFM]